MFLTSYRQRRSIFTPTYPIHRVLSILCSADVTHETGAGGEVHPSRYLTGALRRNNAVIISTFHASVFATLFMNQFKVTVFSFVGLRQELLSWNVSGTQEGKYLLT